MKYRFRLYNYDIGEFSFFNAGEAFFTNKNTSEPMLNTGLVDMNQACIYEGDILEFFYQSNRDFEIKYNKKIPENRWTYVVSFECGAFGYKAFDKTQQAPNDWEFKPFFSEEEGCIRDILKDSKIVGNIYNTRRS